LNEIHGHKRKHGGKVHDDFGASDMKPAKYGKGEVGDLWGDSEMKSYARGGKIALAMGTPVQHSGNKSDTQNIGRGPVITKATGGPIYADGREGKQMGPDIGAGNSGVGRLKKNKLARAEHWEA